MKVRQVAELAKLRLTPEEEAAMDSELAAILRFVEQMQPAETAENTLSQGEGLLRADIVRPSMERETLLALAPSSEGEYLSVPRTLAEEGEP